MRSVISERRGQTLPPPSFLNNGFVWGFTLIMNEKPFCLCVTQSSARCRMILVWRRFSTTFRESRRARSQWVTEADDRSGTTGVVEKKKKTEQRTRQKESRLCDAFLFVWARVYAQRKYCVVLQQLPIRWKATPVMTEKSTNRCLAVRDRTR